MFCATGLTWLPGQALDRAFMVMGYVFCLSAAFVLAKFVRDSQRGAVLGAGDTPMWKLVVWGGFFTAMGLTGWGLLRMDISETYKAFLGVGWLYLITCTFTLAKMLRDAHEADLNEARLQDAAKPAPAGATNDRSTIRPFSRSAIMKQYLATVLVALCAALTNMFRSRGGSPERSLRRPVDVGVRRRRPRPPGRGQRGGGRAGGPVGGRCRADRRRRRAWSTCDLPARRASDGARVCEV